MKVLINTTLKMGTLKQRIDKKSMSDAVKKQCNVYENFYHDQTVKKKTIRFFVNS